MRSSSARLILVSALSLFLELSLIRWVGTEINIFSYLQNTVLVVCFLGLGAGCLTAKSPVRLERSIGFAFVLALLLSIPAVSELLGNISLLLSAFDDLLLWHMGIFDSLSKKLLAISCGLALTLVVTSVIWQIFLPLGRILGRLFDEHDSALKAYSLNILGSLLGVWLLAGLSVLSLPPFYWVLMIALGYFALLSREERTVRSGALLVGMIAAGALSLRAGDALELKWSPYQKLSLHETPPETMWFRKYGVLVNNVGFQCLMDFRPEVLERAPADVDRSQYGYSHYDLPFLVHPDPKRVLVVGAGTGTDLAAALRHGAERVVGVEIDPVVMSFGRKYHPESPYSSPKVTVINADARTYLASSHERFDVIDFGLLDSHTTPVMTNVRLDHFVYTKESIAQAYSLLAPGGVISLAFNVQRPFIGDRIAEILRQVTGTDPVVVDYPLTHYGPGGMLFFAGDPEKIRERIEADAGLRSIVERLNGKGAPAFPHTTRITTDDWPYLYLESASVPRLYWLLGALVCLLSLIAARQLAREGESVAWGREELHFCLLGAAFMLFETVALSRGAAVFGTTWLVNAVIISGVLIMILVANALVALFPRMSLPLVYAALCVACAALTAFDYSVFYALSEWPKLISVGLLTTSPLLLSGIVFARSFVATSDRESALGANLVGALVGGLLQPLSFVTGIKALLLVVLAFYVLAFMTLPCSRAKPAA